MKKRSETRIYKYCAVYDNSRNIWNAIKSGMQMRGQKSEKFWKKYQVEFRLEDEIGLNERSCVVSCMSDICYLCGLVYSVCIKLICGMVNKWVPMYGSVKKATYYRVYVSLILVLVAENKIKGKHSLYTELNEKYLHRKRRWYKTFVEL